MSEEHQEEHSSGIKTPKQLIIVVLAAFLVPITLFAMLSQLVTTGYEGGESNVSGSSAMIDQRLKPVGQLEVIDPNAPKVEKTGKEIVDAVCTACHGTGALNAPKIGDKGAWSKRIAEGLPHLVQHAIAGMGSMPARGGNPDLDDAEITRAIVYMSNQSGANFKEPPAPAAPAPQTAQAKPPAK